MFNTTGDERTGKVTVVLDAKRDYNKWLWDGRRDMKAWELPEYVVVDSEGNVQKATVEDADVKFGYDLPDDKFRQPYMARQVKVSLLQKNCLHWATVPMRWLCRSRWDSWKGQQHRKR